MKGRIDLPHFARITAANHARAYGLYPKKGTIAVGSDADLVLWDPSVSRRITHAGLHDGSDYTPYEGLEVTGWPIHILLRGQSAIENGNLVSAKGAGAFLPRSGRSRPAAV